MEQKFYICKHCGNIIAKVKDAGVPVVCCGEPMSEIVPGTTDAAVEKHVPVWTVENGIVHVKVGSVEHPMRGPARLPRLPAEQRCPAGSCSPHRPGLQSCCGG